MMEEIGCHEGDESYDPDGYGEVRCPVRRVRFLRKVRKEFVEALIRGGQKAETPEGEVARRGRAEAAAQGLFLHHFHVCEDGGCSPRTVEVRVKIFSSVGRPRQVELDYMNHSRARKLKIKTYCNE
jgi:hypothetical protein